MPLYDVNYVLLNAATISATASGPDVSMVQGGQLEGLKSGMIVEARLIVNGAIDDTTDDESMQFFIDEKVGTLYRTVACFPLIGNTSAATPGPDDNPDVDNAGRALRCFFTPSYNATALRYRSVAGGTTPSCAGVTITLHPQNYSPSI